MAFNLKISFVIIICCARKILAFFLKVLYNMFMKEFRISDIENLEQYVYETVEPQILQFKESFHRMGFVLKSELIPISDKNDSLIRFTVRSGDETFALSICFIANGENGGYYVSPLIKEGDITNDVVLLLEQLKSVLLEKGFEEAKQLFDGVQKDAYKQNSTVHKTLKVLKVIFFVSLVLVLGAIIVFLITIT